MNDGAVDCIARTVVQPCQWHKLWNGLASFIDFFLHVTLVSTQKQDEERGLALTWNTDQFSTFAPGLGSRRPGFPCYLDPRHFLLIVYSFFKNLYQYCRYQYLRWGFVKLGYVLSF